MYLKQYLKDNIRLVQKWVYTRRPFSYIRIYNQYLSYHIHSFFFIRLYIWHLWTNFLHNNKISSKTSLQLIGKNAKKSHIFWERIFPINKVAIILTLTLTLRFSTLMIIIFCWVREKKNCVYSILSSIKKVKDWLDSKHCDAEEVFLSQ